MALTLLPNNAMTFTENQHGTVVLERLRNQRDTMRCCDVILHVMSRQFHAHRCVLAACSPYFDSILKAGKTVKEQLTISGQDPEVFRCLLSYMYTGTVVVDKTNVSELLRLANKFLVGKLKNHCAEYLERYLDSTNCLTVYDMANKFRLLALEKTSISYINSHILDVIKGDEVLELPQNRLEELLHLVNVDELKDSALILITRWVYHCGQDRERSLRSLLTWVQWSRVNPPTISNLTESHPLYVQSPMALFFFLDALNENGLISLLPLEFLHTLEKLKTKFCESLEGVDNEGFLNFAISTAIELQEDSTVQDTFEEIPGYSSSYPLREISDIEESSCSSLKGTGIKGMAEDKGTGERYRQIQQPLLDPHGGIWSGTGILGNESSCLPLEEDRFYGIPSMRNVATWMKTDHDYHDVNDESMSSDTCSGYQKHLPEVVYNCKGNTAVEYGEKGVMENMENTTKGISDLYSASYQKVSYDLLHEMGSLTEADKKTIPFGDNCQVGSAANFHPDQRNLKSNYQIAQVLPDDYSHISTSVNFDPTSFSMTSSDIYYDNSSDTQVSIHPKDMSVHQYLQATDGDLVTHRYLPYSGEIDASSVEDFEGTNSYHPSSYYTEQNEQSSGGDNSQKMNAEEHSSQLHGDLDSELNAEHNSESKANPNLEIIDSCCSSELNCDQSTENCSSNLVSKESQQFPMPFKFKFSRGLSVSSPVNNEVFDSSVVDEKTGDSNKTQKCALVEESNSVDDAKNSVPERFEKDTREFLTKSKCAVPVRSSARVKESAKNDENKPVYDQTCDRCNEHFCVKRKYYLHMRSHFPGPSHQCDSCDMEFKRIYYLLDHRETHGGGVKSFKCPTCPFTTRKKFNLTKHMEHHSQNLRYKCKTCGFRTNRLQHLSDHQTKHTDERPFLCETCGWSAKTRSLLLMHTKRHTGQLLHCQYQDCSYATAKRDHLKEHMLSHSKFRPFVCPVCNKGFITKGKMNRHSHTHQSEMMLRCPACDYSTYRSDRLKEHLARHDAKRKPKKKRVTKGKRIPHKLIRRKLPSVCDVDEEVATLTSSVYLESSEMGILDLENTNISLQPQLPGTPPPTTFSEYPSSPQCGFPSNSDSILSVPLSNEKPSSPFHRAFNAALLYDSSYCHGIQSAFHILSPTTVAIDYSSGQVGGESPLDFTAYDR